jgi:hypothetical protein
VVLQPLVVLQFDRILSRGSVARANYAIVSGTSKDLSFKQIRVDPVERAVIFSLEEALLPSVEYKLVIRAAEREADRLAAYDGTPFEGTYTIAFDTRPSSTPAEAETDIDPGGADPCGALKILQGSCAGARCHGETVAGDAAPAMGLSFASNAAIQATALGKAASEVQSAAGPRVGSSGAPFPYGMQLIAPNDSASSFLLYKILMDTNLRDSKLLGPGDAYPINTAAQAPLTPQRMKEVGAELSRVIPGAPMPHPSLPPDDELSLSPYEPLTLANVRLLRAWIDRGAPACGIATGDAGTSDGATDGSLDASDATAEAAVDAADGG